MKLFFLVSLLCLSVGIIDNEGFQDKEIPDEQICIEYSQKLIQKFENELNSSLQREIQQNGIENSIDGFSFDAQFLTHYYQQNDFFFIKRVTDKYRNENNLIIDYEEDVINELKDRNNGNSIYSVIWNFFYPGFTFYYYESIIMKSQCLICHGDINYIPRKIMTDIKTLYPNDQAINYQIGDLRGMYVVMIRWPEARDTLESIFSQ